MINSVFLTKNSAILAGTMSGIFISRNGGSSWLNATSTLPQQGSSLIINCFVTDGSFIFANVEPLGIYRSSDDGTTWSPASQGTSPQFAAIAVSGKKLLWVKQVSQAVYQSTDEGASWTQISQEGASGFATLVFAQDSVVLNVTGCALYRSSVFDSTWTLVRPLPIPYKAAAAGSGSKFLLGLNNYVVLSTDEGLTWSSDSVFLNCNSIYSLAFSPAGFGANYAFAATDSGVFRSSDNGESWSLKNSGLARTFVFSLAFKTDFARAIPMLYAGTAAGLYCSADYGETWAATGIFNGSWVLAASSSSLFAGTSYDVGISSNPYQFVSRGFLQCEIYRSTDEGGTWTEADTNLPRAYPTPMNDRRYMFTSLAAETGPGGKLFVGTTNNFSLYVPGAVFASSDDGSTWAKALSDSNLFVFPIVAVGSTRIFCGTAGDGIFYSADHGSTWMKADSEVGMAPWYTSSYVNAFSFDDGKIYAGGGYSASSGRISGLFNYIIASTDSGESWMKVDSGLTKTSNVTTPLDTTSLVTCLHADGSHILVGTKAYLESQNYSPVGGGFYRLTNTGSNWIVDDSSLMGRQIYSLAVSGSLIFAATDSGVFCSGDGGISWANVSSGLANLNVSSLACFDGYLFAAATTGVWKRPLSELTLDRLVQGSRNIPREYSLSQNYPNPFNPSTTISYSIASRAFVSLCVYDVLGRKIATLLDENKEAGSYTFRFDGSAWASGVYFYRLEAGSFSATKKFVLIK